MSKTVLAVDDSVTMLQIISLALETEGYKVVTAEDGVQGLERLKGDEKFHVIITDVNMPNMDGITFTKKIREDPKYKFTPIIILTTESQTERKSEGMAAGANAWVVKPFQPDQVISVLRKVCP